MAHSALYVKIMNSARWRNLRNEVISEHPVCQECMKQGIVRPSRCVHHVVPIDSCKSDKQAIETAFRRSNLVALCFEHHAAIHKAERSHSKESHKQRQAEALERFKQRVRPNNN